MVEEKKTAFVTGWPVEHSRSPLIHNYWLDRYGIEGAYVKHPCAPDDLPTFVESLKRGEFVGGNVTVPHKESVFKMADQCDETASRLGAVNTLWIENGVLWGGNSDTYGFLANLDDQMPGWDNGKNRKQGALVIGAGGAARAIIYGLIERGFSRITIENRTLSRAHELAGQFGSVCEAQALGQGEEKQYSHALLVNTTTLGMNGKGLPFDVSRLSEATIVNDIVYTPFMTPLLLEAKNQGMTTVDGLGMLLHQAAIGFERWFGKKPEVTSSLRDILLKDLGEL